MVILLLKKMLRDMKKSGVTYVICILITAVGFCGYSVLSLSSQQLSASKDAFYQAASFPDIFAEIQEAPASIAGKLERIPGIDRVEAKLTMTVRLTEEFPSAELKLISVTENGLGVPLLSRGEMGGERELVIGDGFFEAHGMAVGDTVRVVINGRREELTVTGSGLSPENIYMLKNVSDMLPDAGTYDAGFLPYDTFARLFSMEGKANHFVMTLKPGCGLEDVEDTVRQILDPYGCYSVYDRSGQMSASMLDSELKQLDQMALVIPFLFLLTAGVILYITLYRLTDQQRTQAGTLLAIGLTKRAIALHYTGFGLAAGFFGGLLGSISGQLLAKPMADFYRVYFSLPEYDLPLSWRYFIMGTLAASLFCGITGWSCAKKLSSLMPSEALRPAMPAKTAVSLIEKIPRLSKIFTVPGLMAVRSISRNKRRAAISVSGIACAYMITATLVSMNSLINVFMFDNLEESQKHDITVHFTQPVPAGEAFEALRSASVEQMEGVLEFPAELRGKSGKLDCTISAFQENSALLALYDENGNHTAIPKEGIVISEHMADRLGAGIGDTLEVEVSYPEKRISRVEVTGITAQYIGSSAYMSHYGAGQVSEYRNVYTSVLIKGPEEVLTALEEKLLDAPKTALVESRNQQLEKYRGMMGMISGMMGAMGLLGVSIGFAVIYTSSLISFEELKREISTMMLLGLSEKQCLDVISTSQWILTAAAVAAGIPMTMGVSKLMSATMSADLYSIPDFVEGTSLLAAIGLTMVSVLLSSRAMLKKINGLTPVDLLRERE